MKNVGRPQKKAAFQVKKGFPAYSRLSMVSGLVIVGSVPIILWSYFQYPDWLGKITQSINGEENLKNTSDNLSKNQPAKAESINLQPKEIEQTTKENNSSNLTGEIFRQLPDQTINLGKDKKAPTPTSSPKSTQLTNLFPALPKTFVSPYDIKNNNTISRKEILARSTKATPLVTPSTENTLSSSLRRFNANQRSTTPPSNPNYYTGNSQSQPYTGNSQSQPYTGNSQAQPYTGNSQTQPYTTNTYQTQPYTTSPYQTQPYTINNPYQAQPYNTNPYQAQTRGNSQGQPSGTGAQGN